MEGQKLKADGDAFRQKLNTQPLFEEWKKKVCSAVPSLDFVDRPPQVLCCCVKEKGTVDPVLWRDLLLSLCTVGGVSACQCAGKDLLCHCEEDESRRSESASSQLPV